MSQQELVRFPARLQPEVHRDLVAYSEKYGISINSTINALLSFVLGYVVEGRGNELDSLLPEYGSNLMKMQIIIEEYIQKEVLKEFEDLDQDQYLEHLAKNIQNVNPQDRKLLSELAYSLANKK